MRRAETAREWCGVAVCAAVFIFLRLPLYTEPGLRLGWHSDAALVGLMAREMVHGEFPWIFWASDYLWPLTSLFAAAIGLVLGRIDPLVLRIATGIEVFAALVFFHVALRRLFGWRPSLLAMFWLSAGPAFFFKLTYAPLSAEWGFFVASVVFWYVSRGPFTRLHQWLIFGLMAGLAWWIYRGAMMVVLPALAVLTLRDRPFRRAIDAILAAIAFSAGAALGVVPMLYGRLLVDQRLYGPVKASWRLDRIFERIVDTLTYDFWLLIGADGMARWLFGAVMLTLLIVGAAKLADTRRETLLAAGVLLVSFAFWIFSVESYRGAVRYIMHAVPILYVFAAGAIAWLSRRQRAASALLAAFLATALLVSRSRDAFAVAAGLREQHEHWPGGFDPRPALQTIADNGYTVCYANVWVAHKLEWLSEPAVRFIPYRSVNRRFTESLRLAARPGRKCFVDLEGNVRTLTADEERALRLDVLWQSRGWRRLRE